MWAVEPSNPSKVKVYGPGVEKGVKTNQQTYFTVDCKGAGSGMLNIYFYFFFISIFSLHFGNFSLIHLTY